MKAAITYFAGALILAAMIGGVAAGASKNSADIEITQDELLSESLMRQKLRHSQKLLEALSIGDFQRIASSAEELQRISLEARWRQPQAPAYSDYGDEFRRALERVVRASEDQNIDGAALNFVQVILTCVQCHKVVRDGQQIASVSALGQPESRENDDDWLHRYSTLAKIAGS